MTFYDGTKLLNMMDQNGKRPEMYFCVGNRTAGKTFYFNRLAINKFTKSGGQFMYIYRTRDELTGSSEKIYSDVIQTKNLKLEIDEQPISKGIARELYLNKKLAGYAVSLNYAEKIKKMSHLFYNVIGIIFDEFQTLDQYCPNELRKLLSIHTSVARGGGQTRRYVPIYMISNAVSVLNPYFSALNIGHLLRQDTHFLRGDGWVMEQTYNSDSAKLIQESGIMRAFSSELDQQLGYKYCDNTDFVEKMYGSNSYLCTLRYKGSMYGVRQYDEITYVSSSYDKLHPQKFACTANDMSVGFTLTNRNTAIIGVIRLALEHGNIRFDSLESKEAIYNLLY